MKSEIAGAIGQLAHITHLLLMINLTKRNNLILHMINELVNNVKQVLQDGTRSTEDCIKDIENQIDTKENQIRQLFADNIDSVIQHYLKYQQTLFHHKRLEADCQEFSKHIEKAQKLNSYDEQLIEKSQKSLEQMKKIKAKLSEYRNYVKLAKKAAFNIREEKYNNAIKSINQFKRNQLKMETPLKKVRPILEKKVEEHLKKLLQSFWEENKKKMLDVGKTCFQRMSSNLLEKMNIYQIFFGDNMTRSSVMNRNSASSFRCTVLEKENSSRIMKTSEQTEEYFNKMMVRVNVEMSTVKKVKTMVVELNSQGIFNEMLRNSLRDYLALIQESHCCEKEEQFTDLLSEMIGLMLVKRQVCAVFDLMQEEKVFLTQMYIFIGRQIKSLTFINKTVDIVISLKDYFLIFHRILNILKLNESNENFNSIVTALLKTYSDRNMQSLQVLSAKEIERDNMTHFVTQDEEKETMIRQMLDLGSEQFKFTSYVIFVAEYFMKTYNEITKLLEESDINQNVIGETLKALHERVLKIYGSEVLGKDQHYEIIQGEVNIIHIHKVYKYLLRQLEIYHGVVANNSLEDKYQQLIVKLTRNILQVIRQKMIKLMEDYHEMSPNNINASNNDFVEWTLQFVNHIIIFMKEINCPNYESIMIETMREMCELYWEYLKGLKEVNLIIIYNLDVDLSFIYRYCAKNFPGNIVMLDKFKSLREFYSLMLTNNIQDLLDPQKRTLSYPNLSLELLISMLKKYTQPKSTGGKIRELKKKEVQGLVKKLLAPVK